MSTRYAWRPGSCISLDPQKAGRELEDVRKRNEGALSHELVLERAKSANSALHGHFLWDDSEAAQRYRLGQAGDLIRAITIDISRSNVEPAKTIRAFVSVERHGKRSYTAIQEAMSDEDLRLQVVAQAWRDLVSWRERHKELVEFARVFTAIDDTASVVPSERAAS